MVKKVLIVDDSEANLFLLKSIFDDINEIDAIAEVDSRKVLGLLREVQPDLLLLDLMMPHIDGFRLLHEIRADPGFAAIPVIVVSARHDQEAIDTVMDYGVIDYIKKPVNLTETEQIVRKALALRKEKGHVH